MIQQGLRRIIDALKPSRNSMLRHTTTENPVFHSPSSVPKLAKVRDPVLLDLDQKRASDQDIAWYVNDVLDQYLPVLRTTVQPSSKITFTNTAVADYLVYIFDHSPTYEVRVRDLLIEGIHNQRSISFVQQVNGAMRSLYADHRPISEVEVQLAYLREHITDKPAPGSIESKLRT